MREITTRLSICPNVGALLAAPCFLDASRLLDEGAASGAPTLFRIGLVLPLFVLIHILFLFRVRHGAQ